MKRLWYQEYDYGATATEIIVSEEEPKFTGLYDSFGRPLYRQPERVPIGFMVDKSKRRGRRKG